jgi:hypothetical protein
MGIYEHELQFKCHNRYVCGKQCGKLRPSLRAGSIHISACVTASIVIDTLHQHALLGKPACCG